MKGWMGNILALPIQVRHGFPRTATSRGEECSMWGPVWRSATSNLDFADHTWIIDIRLGHRSATASHMVRQLCGYDVQPHPYDDDGVLTCCLVSTSTALPDSSPPKSKH